MKSLIQRMLVSTAIAIVALGPAGNAMAANPNLKAQAPHGYQAPLDVAAIPPYPYSSAASPTPRSPRGYAVAAGQAYPQPAGSYPVAGSGVDVGQLIGAMLGGLPPQYAGIVQNAMRESASHGSSGSYESSGSYDYSSPSPAVEVDNSQSQAAIDASDQAMQQEDQNLQDLDASIAAAEQQNDAANAAMVQQDINNGM
jgi:hypothetical protein